MSALKSVLILFFLSISLFSCKGQAQEPDKIPLAPQYDLSQFENFRKTKIKGGILNDYDGVFDSIQKSDLANMLSSYNSETGRQIVVVTLGSLEPYSDIQKLAMDLGNYWEVGEEEKDNGLIILLCKPCREISIATGYGTEKVLTDKICQEIINTVIIPELKNGYYYEGIKIGIKELIYRWE